MKRRLSFILKVVISLVLLFVIFRKVQFKEILAAFAVARPLPILIGLALVMLGRWVSAMRIKRLTDSQRMGFSTWQHFSISSIATFYGMALPGMLAGGAIRWHRFSRQGVTVTRSLAALTFDRILDTIALVICGLGFWLAGSRVGAAASFGWILVGLLAAWSAAAYLLVHPRILGAAWKVLERAPMTGWMRAKARQFVEDFSSYHKLPEKLIWQLMALSILRHLIGTVGSFAFAASLGLSISWLHIGWIRSLMMIVAMLPISISGFGVREVGAAFLLGLYGVPASAAVAWSLLSFTRTLLPAAIGGLLEAHDAFFNRSGKKSHETLAVSPVQERALAADLAKDELP